MYVKRLAFVLYMCYYNNMVTIKELRERKAKTQDEVVKDIGLGSRSNYSKIENRKHKPRPGTRRKLAEYFGIDVQKIEF